MSNYAVREMQGLLDEHWSEVSRAGKYLGRHGPLTIENFAGSIAHELALSHRDIPALMIVLRRAERNGSIDLQALREQCVPLDPVVHSPRSARGASRRKYDIENHGAPYAVRGDAPADVNLRYESRQNKMRNVLLGYAAPGTHTITRENFLRAAPKLDRNGVSRTEAIELLGVLDPKRSGTVDIDDFCARFAKEYLKPKSMRNSLGSNNNDGKCTAFEWRASLLDASPRANPHMATDSEKHTQQISRRAMSARSARPTRASDLRKIAAAALTEQMELRYQLALSPTRKIPRPPAPTAVDLGNAPRPPRTGRLGSNAAASSSASPWLPRVV